MTADDTLRQQLPAIPQLKRVTQSLAMVEAIVCPEWEMRWFSYNSRWGPDEEMASMRDGCGDDWMCLFCAAGVAIKGLAHELANDAELPARIQAEVPADFASFLSEPAFSMDHATFCYWRKVGDAEWSKVGSSLANDGSQELLALLVSGPEGYVEWATDYHEQSIAADVVEAVFEHRPLTDALIRKLNPDADVAAVRVDALEVGYPIGDSHE